VAIIAGNSRVSPAKFKPAGLHVVERPAFPLLIAMTDGAILRKPQLYMGRRIGILKIP
jgi:hypothetical protein